MVMVIQKSPQRRAWSPEYQCSHWKYSNSKTGALPKRDTEETHPCHLKVRMVSFQEPDREDENKPQSSLRRGMKLQQCEFNSTLKAPHPTPK